MDFDDEGFGSALNDSRFQEWESEFDGEASDLRKENAELTDQLQAVTAQYEALSGLLEEVADGMEADGAAPRAELLRSYLDNVEDGES